MKKQPYLAKERIFKTLHPTFIPKPKPPAAKAAHNAGREDRAAREGAARIRQVVARGGADSTVGRAGATMPG